MENREDIRRLIERYRLGTATEEEVRHLLHQIQSGTNTDIIETAISAGLLDEPSDGMKQSADMRQKLDALFEQIEQRRQAKKTSPEHRTREHSIRKWISVVAAAALIAVTIGWLLTNERVHPTLADIAPGGNRATLTLADGRTIDLNEAQSGIVVSDRITYLDGSSVTGEPVNKRISELHTLTTPEGGTYQITLPDGTKVWLNAASTLKYPARFDNKARVVELEGEAYFDVSKHGNKGIHKPFKVITNGQTIEVLGTSFNVDAYPDGKVMTTTLVSGSLRVTLDGGSDSFKASVVLKPGEAAIHTAEQLEKRSGDLAASTAWRDGYFVFNNATMETIAGQIGRWYGIEVDCIDLPHQTFTAEIPRSVKLSTLLKLIESTSDFHCELIYNPDNPSERRLMITK